MAQQSMIAVSLISHHTIKRLWELILEGNSFAHRVCNIHSVIKWLSEPPFHDYYIIEFHRKTVAPNRAQTVCISKFPSPYSIDCVSELHRPTYDKIFRPEKRKMPRSNLLLQGMI